MDNKKVNKEEVVESLFEMLSNGNLSDSDKETVKNAIKLLLTGNTVINNHYSGGFTKRDTTKPHIPAIPTY